MNVAVSVYGRFHAFELAKQLDRHGMLGQLFTSYPPSLVRRFGAPVERTTSLTSLEYTRRAIDLLPERYLRSGWHTYQLSRLYDYRVSKRVTSEFDLFHGFSSMSQASLLRAKSLGIAATVYRGSAHINTQYELLRHEYETFGAVPLLPHEGIMEMERAEYEIADKILISSEFSKRTFLERGFPESRLMKVPLGANRDVFKALPREDDTFRVIYAGNMSLQKGVQYLLQAWAELALPDAELWLVGDVMDEVRPLFRKYEGTYRHFGHLPQEQLAWHLSQCSLFALCSIQDGFGQVIVQAMACGLPVMATTNTGGPDVLTEGVDGWIIPIRDVEAIKRRVLFAYENRERADEMGQAALARIDSLGGWDSYGDQVTAEFQRVVSRLSAQ